jgi:RHS repeat-associated protein
LRSGNVRLSYSDTSKNGIIENSEIIAETNFYPFGLKHQGYNSVVTSTNPAQKRLYNGKELQDELDLNVYDYGARIYDPANVTIWQVDPLAETSRRFSPYAYALNNPVYFIDPDGMQALDFDNKKSQELYPGQNDKEKHKSDDPSDLNNGFAANADNRNNDDDLDNFHKDNGSNYLAGDSDDNGYDQKGNEINKNGGDTTDYIYDKEGNVLSSTSVKYVDSISSNGELRGYGFKGFRMASGSIESMEFSSPFFPAGMVFKSLTGAAVPRVFWSGGNVAKNAAAEFAGANGMKTLEMTTAGKLMNSVSPYLPRTITNPIWNNLSSNFAKGAAGEVNFFTTVAGPRATSIWLQVEKPILQSKGINIITNTAK